MKTRQLLIVVMFLFASAVPVRADDPVYDQAALVSSLRNRAAQGEAGAQTALGGLYSEGVGVPQDYVQAHKWLNLAAAASPTGFAAEMREYVATRMTPAQIAEAQKLASEWKTQ